MPLPPAAPRVLVVGGGPVGLAAGLLLEQLYGVPARVVERQARPTTHPQAHFLNLRSMEVLYATMPAFHDRLLAHAAPSRLWRDYIYCTGGGSSREFARVDQFGPCIPRSPDAAHEDRGTLRRALAALSPSQFLHFPQNQFEQLLGAFAAERGLRVDRGVELVGLEPAAGRPGGRTRVSLRHLAANELEHAEFDYVVAADGAHSTVRQLSGIDMAGARNLQTIANVHFTSRSLSEAARENPAMLYFVFNQDVIGVLIAHDLHKGEWVFQIPFFPPQESLAQDFSEAQCKALVAKILPAGRQPDADDVSILSVGQWRMGARVAKQYDVGRRVFLVGDAAHQFPPAGGFGMNTGLQDAHNLAWKLALAIQSRDQRGGDGGARANDSLLASYQSERQLVAKVNTQFALRNVERTMKVPTALNVSHHNAKLLAALVNSAPLRLLPLAAQRAFVQRVMTLGKLPLGALDVDASALGDHMRRKVQAIVGPRRGLGMMFYHFDVGFSYDTTAWAAQARQLMQEPALDQAALFRTRVATGRGPPKDMVFSPAFREGVRFPHWWLEDPAEDQRADAGLGARLSTLDLVGRATAHPSNADKSVQYVLVADAADARGGYSELRARVPPEIAARNVSLALMTAGEEVEAPPAPTSAFRSVLAFRVATDEASADAWRAFQGAYEAALVRPDGHVASLWPRTS